MCVKRLLFVFCCRVQFALSYYLGPLWVCSLFFVCFFLWQILNCVAPADLEFVIVLPPSLKCWDYKENLDLLCPKGLYAKVSVARLWSYAEVMEPLGGRDWERRLRQCPWRAYWQLRAFLSSLLASWLPWWRSLVSARAPYFPGPRTIETTYHRPELWVKANRSPWGAGCLGIASQGWNADWHTFLCHGSIWIWGSARCIWSSMNFEHHVYQPRCDILWCPQSLPHLRGLQDISNKCVSCRQEEFFSCLSL